MIVEYIFDNVQNFFKNFETCKMCFLNLFTIEGALVLRSQREFSGVRVLFLAKIGACE
jgi:hypothetical protein